MHKYMTEIYTLRTQSYTSAMALHRDETKNAKEEQQTLEEAERKTTWKEVKAGRNPAQAEVETCCKRMRNASYIAVKRSHVIQRLIYLQQNVRERLKEII